VARRGRLAARAAAARALRLGPTRAGIAALFEQVEPRLDGVASLHLWAHLWWDEARVDFTRFHAGLFTREWVERGGSTVAAIARRYLPAD
jgi:hypothetical protein